MLTQNQVNAIRDLHNRRYSQSKIATRIKCSRSTVRNYLGLGKKPYKLALPQNTTSKTLNILELFVWGTCDACGITYPMPKFMPFWCCPVCRKPYRWADPPNKGERTS